MGSDRIRRTSATFPPASLDEILRVAAPFTADGHFLYPADAEGSHTRGFFAFEPVARHARFVAAIADDIEAWRDRLALGVDVVFAPAQPATRALADAVAARLGVPRAYWEYRTSGRYGDRLVEGAVGRGARALVLNAVSLQGRCVGLRLPAFLERLGGTTAGAAVFAKGSGDLVRRTEERLGPRFYSTLQVDVPIYAAAECPSCASGPPVPWTEFAEAARP